MFGPTLHRSLEEVRKLHIGLSANTRANIGQSKKHVAEFYVAALSLDKIAFRVYCTMNCSILC